jgi:hypothetical protein
VDGVNITLSKIKQLGDRDNSLPAKGLISSGEMYLCNKACIMCWCR